MALNWIDNMRTEFNNVIYIPVASIFGIKLSIERTPIPGDCLYDMDDVEFYTSRVLQAFAPWIRPFIKISFEVDYI